MDREGFRERFKAYKNGKSISEIYDAGLPRYGGGKPEETDDEFVPDPMFTINHEGFEPNIIGSDPVTGAPYVGSGIEIPSIVEQVRKTGRWSAEDNKKAVIKILSSFTPKLKKTFASVWPELTSDLKNVLHDIAYNIGIDKFINESPNFIAAVLSGDTERAKKEMNWGNHQARGLVNRNKDRLILWGKSSVSKPMSQTTAAEYNAAHQWEPAPVVIHSDYPIVNSAPASISSWNNQNGLSLSKSEYNSRRAYENILNLMWEPLLEDDSFLPQLQIQEPGLNVTPVNFVPENGFKPILYPTANSMFYLYNKIKGYKNGKSPIYIKPSKRGSFTAAAKKHGASVAEFERRVLKNPEKYSKAMRKKAQFSHNARSWKH